MCAIIGKYPSNDLTGDDTASAFISGQGTTSGMSGTFIFISDPTDTITDINLLLEQYLKLSYYGIKGKDPLFNVNFEKANLHFFFFLKKKNIVTNNG